jgi:hypothetical protein
MKKIISLFKRDYGGESPKGLGNRLCYNEVVEGAEWVIAGEGIATQKWDGTCCMIRSGRLYKRYDAKHGKTPPQNFEPAQDADPVTGHWPGWIPVGDGPEDRWHREALAANPDLQNGTYELVGPRIQGNPENINEHRLFRHGVNLLDAPRTFDGLRDFFLAHDMEGIVWHHPDGRMVKVKAKDFGIKRTQKAKP